MPLAFEREHPPMGLIAGKRDTIAAIATPAGVGGVGIVRISGPRAIVIAANLMGRAPEALRDRVMTHGEARDGDGTRLDEVLAVAMRGPHSFTGEDVAEIHGHGGSHNMARLLRAVLGAGARHAEAGEFTRRAFENGRLDLVRAEAIVDVIDASSERAWRLAQAQLDGSFGAMVNVFRSRATELLAEVEACIDFPEEGEEYLEQARIRDKAHALSRELEQFARTFTLGRALRDGVHVALIGPVNAGKSSLFNALVGEERAIVDDDPGTTRDFVEMSVVWQGVRVTLTDTAGDRPTESRVENLGITRGKERAAAADVVLRVRAADPRGRASDAPPGMETSNPTLEVITKADLIDGGAPPPADGCHVTSARTGEGIEALRQAIVDVACGELSESDDGHVVTSERHRALLSRAAEALRMVGSSEILLAELLASDIREGCHALGEIMGEEVGDDVLDTLFRRFCIGK